MNALVRSFAVVAALLVADEAQAQLVLGPGSLSSSSGFAEPEPQPADLDADGDLDLVVRHQGFTQVRFGDGRGHFAPGVATVPQLELTVMRVGDIDADGHADIVGVQSKLPAKQLVVMRGQGGEHFDVLETYALPGQAGPFATASLGLLDADADGDLDALVCTSTGAGLKQGTLLFENDGSGFLQQLDVSSNVGVGKASAADLNGDGLADVVETLGSPFLSSSLVTRVLLGLPGGLFVEVQAWTGAQLCGLVDLDQDGILDVLNWGPPGDHLVSHLGTGAGFVQGPFTAIPDTGPGSVPVDFDGDGLPDVLIRENWLQGDFAILRGDGKGGFGPQHAVDFRVEHASNTFLFSDVVTDGRPDLVAIIEPQSIAALKVFPNLTYPAGGPLLDLGHAKPGPLGWPILLVSGDFTSGGEVDIHLFLGPPATPAVLVAGLSEALMPFHGGTLVPAPDFALGTLVTDAQGGADVLLHWPPGVPSGTQFTLQYWTVGPSPLASSASSAARLTVP